VTPQKGSPQPSPVASASLVSIDAKEAKVSRVTHISSEITPLVGDDEPKATVTNIRDVGTHVSAAPSAQSFKDVTKGGRALGTTMSYMVTMPSLSVGISTSYPRDPTLQRHAHLDSGANMSLVSQRAYDRNFAGLLEYGELCPV